MGNENNATKVSNKEKAQANPISTGIHRAVKHGMAMTQIQVQSAPR
jgi:hypothetical protein